MPKCSRCGKDFGVLAAAVKFVKETGRCKACEKEYRGALNSFRQAFLDFSKDGIISSEEWQRLIRGSAQNRLDYHEALAFVRGDALELLDRTLAFASADGIISEEEEEDIVRLRSELEIPLALAQPTLDRLRYLKGITQIRRGFLPTVQSSVRLESDELCHLECKAAYHRVNVRSESVSPGRLLATNKKLHFLSEKGGAEIAWKSVMRVDVYPGAIYLELSRKSGNGRYTTEDPLRVGAILDTLTRMAKHQLLAPLGEDDSRHIPHDIRQAVWQRDQGKCVQCGTTGPGAWLEFDHIIPHDKGGANTVNNVQLLCRRCNLQKSDRI